MKYIIDCDPGIDDTIAIFMAKLNKLDIIGFTVSTGNLVLDKTLNNLKNIEDFLGLNVGIYKGKKENKANIETAEFAHGKDGLGDAILPINNHRRVSNITAEDFIIKMAKKYKNYLTIICLGPLTNLAGAVMQCKDISKYLKHVVTMSGSYGEELYKEFNIRTDSHSAKIVFNSNIEDIKVITHEIGIKTYVPKEYVQSLKNSDNLISRFVELISRKYMQFSLEHYNIDNLTAPDPSTIASVIDNSIVKYDPCEVEVFDSGEKEGYFIAKKTDKSNIHICYDINLDKFQELFKKTFN